ncbi:MAG: asparagine synthetase B, partial [Psychrosphaera sp.]|nr:asparagine synthetase B [Psychrosphaera sp.]
MCGITGVWNLDNLPLSERSVHYFNDSLEHRGPDSGGIYIDDSACFGLGHRRLAIQDISSSGAQPMKYEDRYYISYNGEVYNYIELREELKQLGYTFNSGSDTEVVLYAYVEWGKACFKKFNGMWAIAIWDQHERKLLLCVDRFAIKSCVYYQDENMFAFASELKAFAHLQRADLSVNKTVLASKIYSLNVDIASTWLKNAHRLPAGHLLEIDENGHTQLERWWNTLLHLPKSTGNFNQQVETF